MRIPIQCAAFLVDGRVLPPVDRQPGPRVRQTPFLTTSPMSPRLRLIALFFAALCPASALTVVPSALNLQDAGPSGFPAQYGLTIFQDIAQTNPTSTLFDYDTGTQQLTWITTNIDESSDWYFVSAGQTFSWAGITSGDYVAFSDPAFSSTPSFDQTFGDFYLGGTTGLGFTGSAPNRTVLAWAHFQASASGIVLIDSAAAYDAGSIVVGTLNATPIPEPASAAALAALGTLVLGAARRRREA